MILAILQARMSSSRLPGKVMRAVIGRPMIARQIERVQRSRRIDRLIVATSTDPSDDPLVKFLAGEGVAVFRGSLSDVLSRFAAAATAFGPAKHVIRLTADCPLVDWEVIDACVDLHLRGGFDYTSNAIERTFPDGLDVEVMTIAALLRADQGAIEPPQREHVTPFIVRNDGLFRHGHLVQTTRWEDLRWTVDTEADLALVQRIYELLYSAKPDFRSADILALQAKLPEVITHR